MNWYKQAQIEKIAGVDFRIDGMENVAKPMINLDICHDLLNYIWYDLEMGEKLNIRFNDIEPDISVDSFDSPTGQMNIYLKNPNIGDNVIKHIIDQYNNDKVGAIKLKFLGINKSNSRNDTNTARILIEENHTTEIEQLPEMHLSNANANALVQLLQNEGLRIIDPGDGHVAGQMNTDELEAVLNSIDQNNFVIDTYTQEPEEHIEEGKATMIDFGRNAKQFEAYLNILKEMINYIKVNNLQNKVIVFN